MELTRYPEPGFGNNICGIVRWIVAEPFVGGDNNLVGVLIEPRAPPTEGAVRYHVVFAQAHEAKIFETLVGRVPVDIRSGIREVPLFFHPRDIIRKDEELYRGESCGDAGKRVVKICFGEDAMDAAGFGVGGVIAAADVQTHRLGAADTRRRLDILPCERALQYQVLENCVANVDEVFFRLPAAIEIDVVAQREYLGIEMEMFFLCETRLYAMR